MTYPSQACARERCTRFLSHHGPATPAETLRRLAALAPEGEPADVYGAGGAAARLEARVAALLGKPAARFFIKGVTAQLATLSVHAERAGVRTVAMHPLCHLDHDEANAIERVAGLKPVRLGRSAPFTSQALASVTEPLAAVVIELPLRRAGYRLPPLDELEAIARWCRARGVALHIDGARLWEAAAGYGVAPADLAALADTVYVSFYKGLGGLGGAIVAGEAEAVAALAPWKTRFGGDLYTAFPQALSALDGLDRHLPRMAAFVERARALAARLGAEPGLIVNPDPPQVNAFQLLLPGDPATLAERHERFAHATGTWLFGAFGDAPLAGRSLVEVTIGAAADGYTDEEAAGWIRAFLQAG